MAMPYYGVSARLGDGPEELVYGGTDYAQAERGALRAYKRSRGAAYVAVLLDGGTWMDVKHVPGAGLETARLTEPSMCLHPSCGQINPLSCYCVHGMDEETKERYRSEYV